jgi:hypothetical protein
MKQRSSAAHFLQDSGQGWLEFPTVVLTGLGSFGPLIVALILISLGFWDLRLDRSAVAYLRCSQPAGAVMSIFKKE